MIEPQPSHPDQAARVAAAAVTRRRFLTFAGITPAALLLAACGADALNTVIETAAPAATGTTQAGGSIALAPTPACDDDDEPTLAQTAGPFYTPDSPERASLLEDGITGTVMTLIGYVLATDCTPVAGALVDFWHADDSGQYDNVGYRLRGHQFTDANGMYVLETIRPGLYPGRTRHFHVRVQAPDQPILTTQLYFPDEPANASDGIYDDRLLMAVQDSPDGLAASFNFVLQLG
jgi:protocatechuate 3,4-dioxygenase beta subunit